MIHQTFVFPEESAKYTQLIRLLGKEMDGSRLLVRTLLLLLLLQHHPLHLLQDQDCPISENTRTCSSSSVPPRSDNYRQAEVLHLISLHALTPHRLAVRAVSLSLYIRTLESLVFMQLLSSGYILPAAVSLRDGMWLQVFCDTKRGCDNLTRQLRQDGFPALSIHGDKSQQERDWVLSVRLLLFAVQRKGGVG